MTTNTTISLFELGYCVRAGVEPLTLIVRNPEGARYIVNPVTETCSCQWGTRRAAGEVRNPAKLCKHLTALRALVLAQHSQVIPEPVSVAAYNRYEDAMFALICRFDAIERAQLAAEFDRVAICAAPISPVALDRAA